MSKLGRARRTAAERLEDRMRRVAGEVVKGESWEQERAQFWARLAKRPPEVKS